MFYEIIYRIFDVTKTNQMKLELTKKEIKLINKALLNQKMGVDEQRTWESISDKIENATIMQITEGFPTLKPLEGLTPKRKK